MLQLRRGPTGEKFFNKLTNQTRANLIEMMSLCHQDNAVEARNVIGYKIEDCSGFSSGYLPHNIMVDLPNEQASRWSSDKNDLQQFLILRLDQPAILCKATSTNCHFVSIDYIWQVPQEYDLKRPFHY